MNMHLHGAHRRPVRTTLAAVALAGMVPALALAAPPPTAGASGVTSHPTCTAATVATAQQALEAALNSRVTELGTLTAAVGAAGDLTPGDRSTLTTTLSTTTSAIGALVQKAPTDTTCIAVWQDARSMVAGERVFAVVAPQTHLAIAADTADTIEATVAGEEPTIQAAIAAAADDGVDTAAAEASFTDLRTQVTAAQGETSGVPATVLAQTPASYPGSTPVFVSARDGLRTAQGQLKQADADLQAVVADLR
jgi:hypothetical protein